LRNYKDLYRSGNASSPNFSQNRALKDVPIYDKNGIPHVRAIGNGFSTFDHITSGMKRQGKNVWKIKKGIVVPQGLKIVHDRTPNKKGHFMIAPEKDMPLMKYLGLLQELGSDVTKCVKLTPQEIQNA
jgi:hypothetical protein